MPVHCSVKAMQSSEDLLMTYMDIQQQSVMVAGELLPLLVARLNLLSPPYALHIIDNYIDGMAAPKSDMDSFVLPNRWAQLAIGFPPMDWHSPKELGSEDEDYVYMLETRMPTNILAANDKERFFDRPIAHLSNEVNVPKPVNTGVMQKRAQFKRKGTLSDMGPGFGGTRGALIGGQIVQGSGHAFVNILGPVAARPGLGSRNLPIRKVSLPMPGTIQEDPEVSGTALKEDDDDPLSLRLKASYSMAKSSTENIGYIADRAAIRAKKKIVRQLSASEFISPA